MGVSSIKLGDAITKKMIDYANEQLLSVPGGLVMSSQQEEAIRVTWRMIAEEIYKWLIALEVDSSDGFKISAPSIELDATSTDMLLQAVRLFTLMAEDIDIEADGGFVSVFGKSGITLDSDEDVYISGKNVSATATSNDVTLVAVKNVNTSGQNVFVTATLNKVAEVAAIGNTESATFIASSVDPVASLPTDMNLGEVVKVRLDLTTYYPSNVEYNWPLRGANRGYGLGTFYLDKSLNQYFGLVTFNIRSVDNQGNVSWELQDWAWNQENGWYSQ